MPSAKQLAARKRFAALARAGKLRKGSKLRKVRTAKVRRRKKSKSSRKVKHMARRYSRKSRRSARRTLRIPVIGTLLGLGMADAATGGAVGSLVTGNFRDAGAKVQAAISHPGAAARAALPWGAGLVGYGLAKQVARPGVKVGPVRIEA